MRRTVVPAALVAFLSLTAAPHTGAEAKQDVLLAALDAELERTFEKLAKAETPALYFLQYEARDMQSYGLRTQLGATVLEFENKRRGLDVDVRVGSRSLDNTHQIKGRGGRFEFPRRTYTELPLDNDTAALRAGIWRRTDQAYKDALTRFTKVQTNKTVTAAEEDPSDDFSVEEPSTFYESVQFPEVDRERWRSRLKDLSAALKPYPFIQDSSVFLSVGIENRYIVNSEGTRVVNGNAFARLSVSMRGRTEDGMDLSRSRQYDAQRPSDLPDDEELLADLGAAVEELRALLSAPLVDPYSGPAIFRNRATGVFFHEILGHRLEGHRQKLEAEGQTFTKMLGQPVVAGFISVFDDPTLSEWDGQFLRGFYKYDDEGIAARRVALVEGGVLKSFLLSRSPIANFPRSNGHGRRAAGNFVVARMGNIVVEAEETVPYERLREMLIEEINKQDKPYGFIFDDISGGFTGTGRRGPQSFKVIPRLVYRVYPDGRPDEPVRGVDIVGTPLTSFSRILAAADDYDVFNGYCGAESGSVPVAAVAPSILVSEIEIEKKAKSSEKPPILPAPHHAPKEAS